MRHSMTVSTPPEMIEMVDNEINNGRYSTRSEFFRDLLRDWEKKNLKTQKLKPEKRKKYFA